MMKGKYLKKFGAYCLSVGLILGMTGCGGTKESDKENIGESDVAEEQQQAGMHQGPGMENQLTEEELAAYEAADGIEIEELELKTDWVEKAGVSLGDSITVNGTGVEVSKDNTVLITEGGSYVISGELSDGMIQVDTEDAVKLVLAGADIANADGAAIYVKAAEACYIETKAGTKNVLSDGESYADAEEMKATVFSNDRLVLFGEGTLVVNGNYKHAVCSDDEVYVVGGNYELTAEKDGIHTNNWIEVEDGNVNIVSTDDAMQSEGPIVINGGTITIAAEGKGITAYGDLTVKDGTISISKSTEGLESKNDLVMDGGMTEMVGSDDGLNARTSITINGGKLYAEVSNGDALDSNGSMVINGGLVLAFGAQQPEGGIDCDMNEIQINGGIVIGTGGTNSSPSEMESSQVSVLLGSAAQGEMIGILDSQGNTVFAFEAPKAYSNMLLSIETISSEQNYTVYTGGNITGESYHGYYENGIYEGGTESVSFTTDSMVISAGGTSDNMGGGRQGDRQKGDMQRGDMPKEGMPKEGIPEL